MGNTEEKVYDLDEADLASEPQHPLVDCLAAGVPALLLLDARSTILDVNEQGLRLFGHQDAREAVGKSVRSLVNIEVDGRPWTAAIAVAGASPPFRAFRGPPSAERRAGRAGAERAIRGDQLRRRRGGDGHRALARGRTAVVPPRATAALVPLPAARAHPRVPTFRRQCHGCHAAQGMLQCARGTEGADAADAPARPRRHAAAALARLVDAGSADHQISTPDGVITSVNNAACEIFGYTPGELVGQSHNVLMPPAMRDVHDTYMRDFVQTGHRNIVGALREVPGMRRDGTIFPLLITVYDQCEMAGERRFMAVCRDNSSRKDDAAVVAERRRWLAATLSARQISVSVPPHAASQPAPPSSPLAPAARPRSSSLGPAAPVAPHSLSSSAGASAPCPPAASHSSAASSESSAGSSRRGGCRACSRPGGPPSPFARPPGTFEGLVFRTRPPPAPAPPPAAWRPLAALASALRSALRSALVYGA